MATCQLGLGLTKHSGSSPHPELAPHLLSQQRSRGTCGWAGAPSPGTGPRCQALAGKVLLGEHDPIQKLPHVLDSLQIDFQAPSVVDCWPQTALHVREMWPPSTSRPLHLAWTAQPQVTIVSEPPGDRYRGWASAVPGHPATVQLDYLLAMTEPREG